MTHENTKGLATGLGLFSLGVGLSELIAPESFARTIGLADPKESWVRAFGAREIAAGIGLLAQERPVAAMWARVAGDVLDLTTLGIALADKKNTRRRTGAALAAVAGVMALDVAAAVVLSRARANEKKDAATTPAFIVNKPLDACYRSFQERVDMFFDGASICALTHNRAVSFLFKGETVTATFETSIRNTTRITLSSAAHNGRELLRQFKQLMETGEIATTKGQPQGRRSLVGLTVGALEQ